MLNYMKTSGSNLNTYADNDILKLLCSNIAIGTMPLEEVNLKYLYKNRQILQLRDTTQFYTSSNACRRTGG